MAKNHIQYQKGYSLIELFRDYGTQAQCVSAFFAGNGQRVFTALNLAQQVIVRGNAERFINAIIDTIKHRLLAVLFLPILNCH